LVKDKEQTILAKFSGFFLVDLTNPSPSPTKTEENPTEKHHFPH